MLALFAIITIFKTAVNVAALTLMGQALHHAFLAGIMIAQVGEFSFLLAVIAVDVNVISENQQPPNHRCHGHEPGIEPALGFHGPPRPVAGELRRHGRPRIDKVGLRP